MGVVKHSWAISELASTATATATSTDVAKGFDTSYSLYLNASCSPSYSRQRRLDNLSHAMIVLLKTSAVHSAASSIIKPTVFLSNTILIRFSPSATSLQYTLRTSGSRQGASGSEWRCERVTEVPKNVRDEFRLSYSYQKYAHAYNIPILGTENADDEAIQRACYVTRFLFADRRDLREAFFRAWGRVAVMDNNEVTLRIPEHSHLNESYNSARGLGGTLHIPVATGATENLLCQPDDPNKLEDTFAHVLAHTIRRVSITMIISSYKSRLMGAYMNSRLNGLWPGTRAMYTVDEYFAQGALSFFNVSAPYTEQTKNDINTREKLERYDPGLYSLIKEIFPCMNTIVDRCDDQSEYSIMYNSEHVRPSYTIGRFRMRTDTVSALDTSFL